MKKKRFIMVPIDTHHYFYKSVKKDLIIDHESRRYRTGKMVYVTI